MADTTVSQVFGDVCALLGDSDAEIFTDFALQIPFSLAYRELFDVLQSHSLPTAKREAFIVLPAYTNVLIPEAYAVTDLDEPQQLFERGSLTVKAITGVSNTTPISVTCVAHGLQSNTEVTISGVTAPPTVNQRWYIAVTGADTFTLNGSTASGAYGAGGQVVTSPELFLDMSPSNEVSQNTPGARLGEWKWQGERFYFRPANNERQVRVIYTSSGEAPISGTIGIDDARSFLVQRTASIAASTRGMSERAAELIRDAFGPSGSPDGSGGSLRGLILPMIRELQNRSSRPQSFRPRRNISARLM